MPASELSGPSRRTVLCGLAAALLAPGALISACSPGAPAGTGQPGTGAPPAPGGALAKLADIPVGKGAVVTGPNGPLLLVRASETEVKAFNAACPHAGTPVDAPVNGIVTCSNHGSQFDAKTGAKRKGPAETGLTPVTVKVADGQVLAA
ncbi:MULTISPECIES: Rieske (2Fe-2S) protein [unclassified Crossiella]|uniref:Rieske (2Fe-2S) protein n=1 Tax=unclassified Crossiella TaxID=2620835 RepID=UPI001FFF99A5|nr:MULTISPECIES: Rieske (2Fe-2S) protein [unclassified Crossiella]MCK2245493.1 Rieske (2Fe-2S) protein [Crossiella sp. S99.2]MCK2259127.1 Rieske (2Fe-2S) protein [Crossiella sp. S99.1]